MAEIIVTLRDGEVRTLKPAAEQSVMEAIRDSGIADIEAICGGCCACATCHVYVSPEFVGLLPPISEDEQVLIEGTEHFRPDASRLSCQLPVSAAVDGLRVEIAPEG